jgi:hypothetical protein
MKQVNISIHPFSALVGMAVLSMAWVTAAAMPLQGSSSDRDVSATVIVDRPHADWIRVDSASAYVVPDGKYFTLTALGQTNRVFATTEFYVDGVRFAAAAANDDHHGGCSVVDVPPGVVAGPGSSLSVVLSFSSGDIVAYGFLSDV